MKIIAMFSSLFLLIGLNYAAGKMTGNADEDYFENQTASLHDGSETKSDTFNETNFSETIQQKNDITVPGIGAFTETPATVVLTSDPVPVMISPANEIICNNETTNITLESANTGATVLYTWTVSGSSVNVIGYSSQSTPVSGPIIQTLVNSGLAVETVTYIISPVSGTVTGTPVTVVVTVLPTPFITRPTNETICSIGTTNIHLTSINTKSTVSYIWTANGSSKNVTGYNSQTTAVAGPIAQTLTNSGLSVETVTYLISPVIGNCTGIPITVVVTVNPVPIITDPNDQTICSATDTNIPLVSANTGATVLYTWTASGSSANVTGFSSQAISIPGPIVQTLTNNGLAVEKVTYIITPIIGNCMGTPVTVIVSVNPIPVLTNPGHFSLCNSTNTNIPLSSNNTEAKVLYTWTASGSSVNVNGFSPQATAIAGPITQVPINSGLTFEDVTYKITPVISDCKGNPVDVVLTVYPIPVLTNPGPFTIFSATLTNIPLSSNNTGAKVLYTWTVSGSSANITGFSPQATAIAGPIAQTLTNSGLAVEKVTYKITPEISHCPGIPVTVVVTVNPKTANTKSATVISGNNIIIYPNPTTGMIRIEGLRANQKSKIALYTIDGKQIKEISSNSTSETINISDQVLGTYLLRINKLTFKIIKE